MDTSMADAAVGTMMALFGLLGLFLAARAMDDGIYVFGLSLAGFAAAFVFGLIRVHYDRVVPQQAEQPVHV